MMILVVAALFATPLVPQSVPGAPVPAKPEPIFLSGYRICLLGISIARARTTTTPAEAILEEAFVECAGDRRAAKEGGVIGEDPKVSEEELARVDNYERSHLARLIEANRGRSH